MAGTTHKTTGKLQEKRICGRVRSHLEQVTLDDALRDVLVRLDHVHEDVCPPVLDVGQLVHEQ